MHKPAAEMKNPYTDAGFFQLGMIAFLSGLFFPWYLLYRLYSRGWKDTLLLIEALLHDWLSGLLYLAIALAALAVALLVLLVWGVTWFF